MTLKLTRQRFSGMPRNDVRNAEPILEAEPKQGFLVSALELALLEGDTDAFWDAFVPFATKMNSHSSGMTRDGMHLHNDIYEYDSPAAIKADTYLEVLDRCVTWAQTGKRPAARKDGIGNGIAAFCAREFNDVPGNDELHFANLTACCAAVEWQRLSGKKRP